MTLQEAIKVLEELKHHPMHKANSYHKDATQLGIEALKRQREDMMLHVWTFPRPLPGETQSEEVSHE